MKLQRGHSNMKCASVTLYGQKWHNMLSLRIGIVNHKPVTMASIMDHCTKEMYELKLTLNGYYTEYDICGNFLDDISYE
jgi:hypothetical protein